MGRSRQRQRQRERRRQQQTRAEGTAPADLIGRPPSPPRRPPTRRSGPGKGPLFGGGALLVLAIAAIVILIARGTGGSGGQSTPTPGQTASTIGKTIDGIHCGPETLVYHIHQHIDLYLNGKHIDLPAYVGFAITGSGQSETVKCLYSIHVHYENTPNFIHVESPTKKIYRLGQMIDIWKATTRTTSPPDSSFLTDLLHAKPGHITAFSNLKRWVGNYRNIPLTEHETITLEIGKPVVPPRLWTNWSEVD